MLDASDLIVEYLLAMAAFHDLRFVVDLVNISRGCSKLHYVFTVIINSVTFGDLGDV